MVELKTEELRDLYPQTNFESPTQVRGLTEHVLRIRRRTTGEQDLINEDSCMKVVLVSLINKLSRLLW